MRQIVHPGPPAATRVETVEAGLRRVEGRLAPGLTVMEAVAKLFEAAGCAGGVGRLKGGRAEPFRYVMPALSKNSAHAAWYSDTCAPEGPVAIEDAVFSFGRRDGKPFLHCHGIWRSADGARLMGHMLPFDCTVREPIALEGLGSADALFEARPDAETNFTLFAPARTGGSEETDARGLFVRVRPNEDILTAIKAIAAEHGIGEARIHGVGSLNEVSFTDGRRVPSLATELMVTEGRIKATAEGPRPSLDIAVVDIEGGIHQGTLARGDNPVCVTFELVIEILGGAE